MLTFIELLIGVVVIVGVARYIIKGYSATGVLFVGGLLLLIISAIMGHKVLPSSQTSTGYSATDIVERSEEHTSELQSRFDLVCRLLLEQKMMQTMTAGYSPIARPLNSLLSTNSQCTRGSWTSQTRNAERVLTLRTRRNRRNRSTRYPPS